MQADWDIKSRSHRCSQSGSEFQEGEYFYTLLIRDAEGFRREDLSEAAWKERNENNQPFSFWLTKNEPPAQRPPEAIPRDDAEGLLRRLIEENDPAHHNTRYILALMLERKRLLRPMESQDKDRLVYEHISSGDTFVITNPHLSLEQIPNVQREVSDILTPPA